MEEIHRHTIEISRHNRLKEKNTSKLWMTIKRNTIDLPKKFRNFCHFRKKIIKAINGNQQSNKDDHFAQKNYIDIG